MTTIVAAKCPEGVVVACDSQGSSIDAEPKMKKTDINKIIPINDGSGKPALILAASGSEDDITLLQDAVVASAKTRQFKDSDLRGEMNRVLRELFRKYNSERSKDMGLDGIISLYDPDAVLAVKFKEPDKTGNAFGLYHIRYDGLVVPVSRYKTLGSGSIFADFLLNMNDRMLPIVDAKWNDMGLPALYVSLQMVVNQVKHTDLYSGGPTRMAVVTKDGAHEFTTAEMLDIQKSIVDAIDSKMGKGTETEQAIFRLLKAIVSGAF